MISNKTRKPQQQVHWTSRLWLHQKSYTRLELQLIYKRLGEEKSVDSRPMFQLASGDLVKNSPSHWPTWQQKLTIFGAVRLERRAGPNDVTGHYIHGDPAVVAHVTLRTRVFRDSAASVGSKITISRWKTGYFPKIAMFLGKMWETPGLGLWRQKFHIGGHQASNGQFGVKKSFQRGAGANSLDSK